MDNVFKGLLIGAGVLITAIVIGMVFSVSDKGKALFNTGSDQLDTTLQGFNDMDLQMYAGGTRSGTEVIQCIQKYAERDGVYVVVFTKAGGANVYDWTLVTKNGSLQTTTAAGATGGTTSDPFTTINNEAARCSGFPVKDAKGQPLTIVTPGASGADPTCTAFGATGTIKAATQTTDNGSYDATINTQDPGYISANASFTASVQVNQNNEVKFITFVQK